MRYSFVLFVLVALPVVRASEKDATDISATIQARHAPFGAILDPIFDSPSSTTIVGYTRCGDAAIWTGHYLAAESYRYKVTHDPAALANAHRALDALRFLVDVTGTDLMARCAVPVDWDLASGIVQEEQHNGIRVATLASRQWYWAGHTSRDQYSGAFFGLSVAYDLLDDAQTRADISALVTRMVDFLRYHDWAVSMPDGSVSTVFTLRPEQQLAILQIARHVNGGRFGSPYKWFALFHSFFVEPPLGADVLDDNDSYFKFNLDTINLFSLIRWEDNRTRRGLYRQAYDLLRKTTDDHGNAHFNMIDRALNGSDAHRDAETVQLLGAWLRRPRRDFPVDLRGTVAACGDNRACGPIPVEKRVNTDFLWQRSPFQLYQPGDGHVETAGIDYILPYWMARYYGLPVD